MKISGVQVYKFGGSSVAQASGYQRVARIIKRSEAPLVVVLSAMGKTTNALEKVVGEVIKGKMKLAANKWEEIRQKHLDVIFELNLGKGCAQRINDLFDEHWALCTEFKGDADAFYDRVICLGELSSTSILCQILIQDGTQAKWMDARSIIATNHIHRDATVEWDTTIRQVEEKVVPDLSAGSVIVTQGFIGGFENVPTTLGREGSDYSAAIMAYSLDAEDLVIWKDVPGILTGDPREFDNVIKIDRLSYQEAIEMTYYGAKVIHPKTIKPLQNKGICLHVKPFLNPNETGTVITYDVEVAYPPIVVVEQNQALVHISTQDFSFVAEHHMSIIFNMISQHRLKVNMLRNTAISFTVCLTNHPSRLPAFVKDLEEQFKVTVDDSLELITIRHGTDRGIQEIVGNRIVIFEERIKDTVQMVVRSAPGMRRRGE